MDRSGEERGHKMTRLLQEAGTFKQERVIEGPQGVEVR